MDDVDNGKYSSYVDFGTPRTEAMSDPEDLVYLNLDENFFWMSTTQAIRFGTDESHAYAFEAPQQLIFDTGTSITYYPGSIQSGFLDNIIPRGLVFEK